MVHRHKNRVSKDTPTTTVLGSDLFSTLVVPCFNITLQDCLSHHCSIYAQSRGFLSVWKMQRDSIECYNLKKKSPRIKCVLFNPVSLQCFTVHAALCRQR